jgi:hypothetical protein
MAVNSTLVPIGMFASKKGIHLAYKDERDWLEALQRVLRLEICGECLLDGVVDFGFE